MQLSVPPKTLTWNALGGGTLLNSSKVGLRESDRAWLSRLALVWSLPGELKASWRDIRVSDGASKPTSTFIVLASGAAGGLPAALAEVAKADALPFEQLSLCDWASSLTRRSTCSLPKDPGFATGRDFEDRLMGTAGDRAGGLLASSEGDELIL